MSYKDVIDSVQRKLEKEKFRTLARRKNYFIKYLWKHEEVEKVGQGFFRKVFAIDDNHVIKVVRKICDTDNNKLDVQVAEESDLVANCPDYDEENYIWLVQERLNIIHHVKEFFHAIPSFRQFKNYFNNHRSPVCFLRSYLRFYYAKEKYNSSFAHSLSLIYTCDKDFEVYEKLMKAECNTLKRIRRYFFNHCADVAEFRQSNIGFDKDNNLKFADPSTYKNSNNGINWWVDEQFDQIIQKLKLDKNNYNAA